MKVLTEADWRPLAEAHAARVDRLVGPHLARRADQVRHPVHDFLFTYYSQRPAQLRRWHPGVGTALADAPEHAGLKGYAPLVEEAGARPPLVEEGAPHPPLVEEAGAHPPLVEEAGAHPPLVEEGAPRPSRDPVTVAASYVASQRPLLARLHALLGATASRAPQLGCFGLHEWAMVHRAAEHGGPRHAWPLRLGQAGTDAVVESHRIACSHFDAYRFFTPSARGLNTLSPGRDDRAAFEQPGCLHAGMDLYKHAFRLSPMVPSDLVADCFELAWDIRTLDMRAAPYDFSGVVLDHTGEEWTPVRIETTEGKAEYVAAQRGFAERAAPLRSRMVEECERLLATGTDSAQNS